jgi:hypothetical protein
LRTQRATWAKQPAEVKTKTAPDRAFPELQLRCGRIGVITERRTSQTHGADALSRPRETPALAPFILFQVFSRRIVASPYGVPGVPS